MGWPRPPLPTSRAAAPQASGGLAESRAPAPIAFPLDMLDRYDVDADSPLLGWGSFGSVLPAVRKASGSDAPARVAVKVLSKLAPPGPRFPGQALASPERVAARITQEVRGEVKREGRVAWARACSACRRGERGG